MSNEYIKRTLDTVEKRLKFKIKGKVKLCIRDDILICDIYAVNSIVYRHTFSNISMKIDNGYDAEFITTAIEERYKEYIKNLFFNH